MNENATKKVSLTHVDLLFLTAYIVRSQFRLHKFSRCRLFSRIFNLLNSNFNAWQRGRPVRIEAKIIVKINFSKLVKREKEVKK